MSTGSIIALSGGVGGAKLVLGLAHSVPAERLIVVTNTGDDFDHFGLRICPDTDTVIYTLANLADRERGWGRSGETWSFMTALKELGGADWFNLGDLDLALHVVRTDRLRSGENLSRVIEEISRSLGIEATILPMSDQPVATMVETPDGRMAFQHYFVRERCVPRVTGFTFAGVDRAQPNPALLSALETSPAAIIVAPSNPYVSVDPILAVPGLSDTLRQSGAPIVAISPIVGGKAIKGPAAKMMRELGKSVSVVEIARHYLGFIDGLVIDEKDAEHAPAIEALGIKVEVAPTVMRGLTDRVELAKRAVGFASRLSGGLTR